MDFADKTGVLGQLWIEFRGDEDFSDFMEYNDLGLPMAYMVAEGLIKECSPVGDDLINETFSMFLALLEVKESDFDVLESIDLGSILTLAYNKKNGIEEINPGEQVGAWPDVDLDISDISVKPYFFTTRLRRKNSFPRTLDYEGQILFPKPLYIKPLYGCIIFI